MIDPKIQEQMFQEALSHWVEHKDKQSWDMMYIRAIECCLAISKKKCNGINNMHLEERALDAASYIMDLIKRGNRPNKLSSVAYLQVNKFLYSNKAKQQDRELQLSVVQENYESLEGEYNDDDWE